MKRAVWLTAVFSAALLFSPAILPAEEGWRQEFEAVCSKTDASMTLTIAELEDLLARCDKLEETMGGEAEVVRRIFLKRLQRCRDLYAFVLEKKRLEEGAAAPVEPAGAGPETPGSEDVVGPAVPDAPPSP